MAIVGGFGLLGLLITIAILAMLANRVLSGTDDAADVLTGSVPPELTTSSTAAADCPAAPPTSASTGGGLPAIGDAADAATCQVNRATLETAAQVYEITTGAPPADQQAMVDAGILEEPVPTHTVALGPPQASRSPEWATAPECEPPAGGEGEAGEHHPLGSRRAGGTVSAMPDAASTDELTIRRSTPSDRDAVIGLCRASLGWVEGDPNEAFFSWKHDQNPFGASPTWVAVAPDGQLAGVRGVPALGVRRAGRRANSRHAISAVRAVDTATHPDWQGKGIFTRLTLGALDELGDDGLDVVFNTPNDQSRPGYLKMGWSEVGRVPVAVRLRSALSARRVAGARAAAEKWSEPVDVGLDAPMVLAAPTSVQRLLDSLAPARAGIATARSVEYLQWRYAFGPLAVPGAAAGRPSATDSSCSGSAPWRQRPRPS